MVKKPSAQFSRRKIAPIGVVSNFSVEEITLLRGSSS